MMKSERREEDELRKGTDDCIISYLDSYIGCLSAIVLFNKIKKLGDILNGKDDDDAKSENDNAKPEEVGRSNQYHNGAGTM